MANKFRNKEEEAQANETEENAQEREVKETIQKPSKPRKKGVLAKGLSSVFSGSFLTNEKNLKHLPYIIFLAFVAILYIANGYYADDKIRETNKTSNQIKELRSEDISTKSELMFASKQSEIEKSAGKLGLKVSIVPPIKINVDSTALFNRNN